METRTSEKHDPVSRSRWALAFGGIDQTDEEDKVGLERMAELVDQHGLGASVEVLEAHA